MIELPPSLTSLLAAPDVAAHRDAMQISARACWRLTSHRLGRMKTSALGRLLGRRAEPPQLARTASKLGGVPYLEAAGDWPREPSGAPLAFIAQINFAELAAIASPSPRAGIWVLFVGSVEPFYVVRWYPHPTGQAAEISGPTTEHWEYRIDAAPAVSVSFESWWSEINNFDAYDALVDWDAEHGGQLGGWTVATIDGPGPRVWYGGRPSPGEAWLQLWHDQLQERFGSMSQSVVIRREDFEAGRLDRVAFIHWQ